jgi:hypothetical protein
MSMNKLAVRISLLLSHSLAQVDIDKLNASDDQKWSLVAFLIGCVCNSRIAVDTREGQESIVAGILSEIFDWPVTASRKIVSEAFADIDAGDGRIEIESGSRSIREFESAIERLKSLLEADRG